MDINTLVKLTRIESTHNNLRTSDVTGRLVDPIIVGEPIVLVADPVSWINGPRGVITSPVLKIEGNRYYTQNSIYEILPVGDPDGN